LLNSEPIPNAHAQPVRRDNLRHDQIRGRSGGIEAKRAHARITKIFFLCVMTFSVWTESINSGNKSFTSKLSTLSGPTDSSTNPVIEMKGRTVFYEERSRSTMHRS
jgi:hypothetical protein